MIEIFQATNSNVLDFIKDKLVDASGYDKEYSIYRLRAMMDNTPDRVFVGVIFNGLKLVGFLTAWLVTDMPWCWIEQAWTTQNLDRSYVKQMWNMVQLWAEERKCKELRIEVARSSEAFIRKYGFEKVTEILRKEL